MVTGMEYDTETSIMGMAFRVSGTVIPEVLGAFEFWLLLVVNIVVRSLRLLGWFEPEKFNMMLPWALTGTTGSLMTFFACFYNGQQFGRYNRIYDVTCAMFEHALEFASMLRVHIKEKRVQRKAVKLVIASMFVFFFQRTGPDGISLPEWSQLYRLGLVTHEEVIALRRHVRRLEADALPSFLLLQWAVELIKNITEEPKDREDMLAGFIQKIYHIRECQACVTDLMELPMPFQYFHIMNLMMALNLVLWAYSLACQDSHFAPLIFMFVQMMFQGLRELSTSLADPFGNDVVDFPVDDWMKVTWARIYGIIEDDFDIQKMIASEKEKKATMMKPSDFSVNFVG